MKKRVVIFMDIDTDREGSSGARPLLGVGKTIDGIEPYMVSINNSKNSLDTAAHEMGHVLSSVFETPGGMNHDPRPLKEFPEEWDYDTLTVEQADRIWSNEREAWKIGEKIHPGLDQNEKRRALDSYLQRFELAMAADALERLLEAA